eukprot:GFKZ01000472.1.p1 GENE.GFKZ01000472.1~~GFKZ01000472.1.p1  ORF type:complete len:301 (-),score=28.96 GFKZ01000472.1:131-1033(-)
MHPPTLLTKPHPHPSPTAHTTSSTITSSSSDTPPAHSPSPFHSFSTPTHWNHAPPRHSPSPRPSTSLPTPHPYTLPRPASNPPTPTPQFLSPKSSSNLRAPLSSTHAFSELTRRHLSKLSIVSPRESDVDSVLSEPVSYSTSSYVAADMWLVHKDVDNAERALVEREKHRQLHRATLRDDKKPTDVFSTVQEAQDVSSKLVRLFFAGGAREVPSGYNRNHYALRGGMRDGGKDRDRDRGRDAGADAWYGWDKTRGEWDRVRQENVYDSFGGYNKRRRFEKVRRFRWWLRRVASRLRGDGE